MTRPCAFVGKCWLRRLSAPCMVGLTVGLLNTAEVWAQPQSVPRSDFWFPDGPVHTVLMTDEAIYFGGEFDYVGPQTVRAAVFDLASGESSGALPPVGGPVYAVESDGGGGWWLGGQFTQVGGVPAVNLVRLRSDLSVDKAWNARITGAAVYALVRHEGRLYVGGDCRIGVVQQKNLAALDTKDGTVAPWNPDVARAVHAIVVTNGLAYLGGQFTSAGGSNRAYVAAVDLSTGKATDWNPGADKVVRALAVAGDVVYAGGDFTAIGTKPRRYLAALESSTGVATAWNPNPNGLVRALAVSDTTVFVGGNFTTISVANRNAFAAVKRSNAGIQPLDLGLEGATAHPVRSLRLVGSTLHVAGSFSKVQGITHPLVTAVDLATDQVVANVPLGNEYYGASAQAGVWAIGATSAEVLFGGEFYSLGGQARRNLAALSVQTGQVLPWIADASDAVYALAPGPDCVYAGGAFTNLNGAPLFGLAALNPVSGALLDQFAFTATYGSSKPVVRCLLPTDTELYVGGLFTAVSNKTARALAAVDLVTAFPLDFAPNVGRSSQSVFALALADTTLFVGGDFTEVGGTTRNRLAAVDAVRGTLLDWNPNPNKEIKALSLVGDRLYAGGAFQTMGSIELHSLAVFGLPSLELLPADATLPKSVTVDALNALNSAVYVGGSFSSIGGEFRLHAAVLGPLMQAYEWDPAPNVQPAAIGVSERLVCLGGAFTLVGNAAPQYAVGRLAVFDRSPVFTGVSLVGGQLEMEATTGDRTVAVLEVSSDLKTWSEASSSDLPGYLWSIDEPIDPGAGSRFYRIRVE